MKKEEQIKQLKTQLAELQPLMELAKKLPKSHLSDFVSNELATEIKELKGMLEQLEKDSKDAKEDFSDIVITHVLNPVDGIITTTLITIEDISKNFTDLEYVGKDDNYSIIYKATRSDGRIVLFFGKKKEKPLKHPHMKDIVATFCISASDEFEVEKLTDADKINWEDWDKVQPIGEDQEYGIVVKATYRKENPNQFSLFFCEKK